VKVGQASARHDSDSYERPRPPVAVSRGGRGKELNHQAPPGSHRVVGQGRRRLASSDPARVLHCCLSLGGAAACSIGSSHISGTQITTAPHERLRSPVQLADPLERLVVLGDIDDGPVRILHEEPPEPPVLVSEWIDDLGTRSRSALVGRVDIVNLDRDIWMHLGFDIEPHDAELDLALVRPKEEDPVETFPLIEADDSPVEDSTFPRIDPTGRWALSA
jgi:hypothetical protein